ncbi:hypothetical protein [Paenibacillus sp. GCM10028914]|uniref:hypothetical protein n=1 Tax=Paenibacillus sp. GCM10028914 TaxID=3273416 RepID=UPI0036225E04
MKVVYTFLLVILIAGCTELNTKSPVSESNLESEASYVDYINIGDKHYLNAWELALTDTNGITEIGEVEKGSIIPKGTPVYEIAGYPEHDVVAVKTGYNNTGLVSNISGYLLYVLHEEGKSHYPNIHDQQINQINIYRSSKLLRELKGEDIGSFLTLFQQQGPYNEFQFEKEAEYSVLFIGDNALGTNYRVMEKNGQFGLPHIESKLPDEIAYYFM